MQRALKYAIVDEVDNILIDEAGHASDHKRPRGHVPAGLCALRPCSPEFADGAGLHD